MKVNYKDLIIKAFYMYIYELNLNGVRCGFLTFDLSFSWSETLFISDHDTKHNYSSGAIQKRQLQLSLNFICYKAVITNFFGFSGYCLQRSFENVDANSGRTLKNECATKHTKVCFLTH